MKQLVAIGLLVVLGIWLAFSVARGQQFEGTGSQCLSNQNCRNGNCLTGGMQNNPTCSGSPSGFMCRVYSILGGNTPLTFCVCVDSANKQNTCAPVNKQNPIDCGQMAFWNCGCVNGDNVCGYTACKCSGASDGKTDFTENMSCTGC